MVSAWCSSFTHSFIALTFLVVDVVDVVVYLVVVVVVAVVVLLLLLYEYRHL